jgi:hypothetical protein
VAGMVPPREWAEQRRGVIPRRVRVVAQFCGARALNARMREQEQGVTCVQGPSGEADLARGGVQPSSEADLARGGVRVGRGGPPVL